MEKSRVYCSGKHNLYGYKTECLAPRNELATGDTDSEHGSKADLEIDSLKLTGMKTI